MNGLKVAQKKITIRRGDLNYMLIQHEAALMDEKLDFAENRAIPTDDYDKISI